jgi:hypothetical protein
MSTEFATSLQPFILLRSPFALGNKAAIHVGETYNAKRSVVKIMCGTKRGVWSYSWFHANSFRNDQVFATPGCRLFIRRLSITDCAITSSYLFCSCSPSRLDQAATAFGLNALLLSYRTLRFSCSPTRRSIKYHSLEFTTVTRNKQQIDLHQTRGIYHPRQEIKAKHIHTVLVYRYCTIENINQDTIRASPSNRTRNRPTQLEINEIWP